MLVQQLTQCFGPIAEVFQNVTAQLNAGKSQIRNFRDGLRVIVFPRNRRVAETNQSRRRRNRALEVRQISGRIERWIDDASERFKRNSRSSSSCSQAQNEK